MDEQNIRRAADILRQSNYTVVMTGAGIGRPSGIPDFRSDSGLWSKDDPMEAASIQTFTTKPQRFFDWLRPLMDMMLAANPNPAHLALAELEAQGPVKAVITQNIDYLHQEAGSKVVYEVHGNIRTAECFACGKQAVVEQVVTTIRQGDIPICKVCGGTYKPDIVLFGEALPEEPFYQSYRALVQCDTILIVGTSLAVYPAGQLPMIALKRGAKMIIVNLGTTELDAYAEVLVNEDVATALPAIVAHMKQPVCANM